jgi:dihydropteroate synthase
VFPPRLRYHIPLPSGRVLALGDRCLVMGILNVTPDSFADHARALDPGVAVERALAMAQAGADLIDLGAESTRPGAEPVAAEDEWARLEPVLARLAKEVGVPVSVDTYKASVAERALDAGAEIVNDVSGLRYDPALAGVVARCRAALVLMHTRGRSKTMYAEARYTDVAAEIAAELGQSIAAACEADVPPDRIVVDPGIGFAKRVDDSYGVLGRLPEIAASTQRPLLVGPSRKSFMRGAVGERPPAERDWGTAAAVTASVLAGAHIVRVHAVAEMVQVVRVADEIRRHG